MDKVELRPSGNLTLIQECNVHEIDSGDVATYLDRVKGYLAMCQSNSIPDNEDFEYQINTAESGDYWIEENEYAEVNCMNDAVIAIDQSQFTQIEMLLTKNKN